MKLDLTSDSELKNFVDSIVCHALPENEAFLILQKAVAILKGRAAVSKRNLENYGDSQNKKNYQNSR